MKLEAYTVIAMGKISPRQLKEKDLNLLQDTFFKEICSMKTENIAQVLEYLLAESEVVMLARRLSISKMLMQGRTYNEIEQALGVGEATIRSVDRRLSSYHDYRFIFPKALAAKRRGDRDYFPGSFKAARKKYPLHFLLWNLLLDD